MLNINYITKQYYKSHLDELKKKIHIWIMI